MIAMIILGSFLAAIFARRNRDMPPDDTDDWDEVETVASDPVPTNPESASETNTPPYVSKPPPPARQKPLATPPPEARKVEKWLETSNSRPSAERVLLERLAAAERQKNIILAIDTIEKLYGRSTMADLSAALVQRLGTLNMKRLFSETNTPWTTIVTVRRGDVLERIAREHGNTTAVMRWLNPSLDPNKIRVGQTLRVLDFPNAVLVINRKLKTANLSLKQDKLFKRYNLTVSDNASPGIYQVKTESGSTLSARLSALEMKTEKPEDRKELEMFLAPGSRIIVAD